MKKILLATMAVASFAAMQAQAPASSLTTVAHFTMQDGKAVNQVTGTAFTLNSNTLNDVVGTSTPEAVEGIDGVAGSAAHFDGNAYYFLPMADLGDVSFFNDSFTIQLWCKLEAYQGDDTNNGVASYMLHIGDSQTLQWIGVEYNKNQNIQLFSRAGTSDKIGRNVAAGIPVDEWGTYWLLDGNWHYVVGVKNVESADAEAGTVTGNWQLYLDNGKSVQGEVTGEPIASNGLRAAANNYTFPAGSGVTIGTNFTDATPYPTHGALDEIIISKGAITIDEIQYNYENMSNPTGINDIIAEMGANARVSVYTINGMLVAEGSGCVENVISGVNPDMYVVKVSDGKNVKTRKLLVR